MKKLLIVLLICGAFATEVQAQEISKNAIGLRFGQGDGFGAELNYQRAVSDNNRLEFGASLSSRNRYNAVKLIGLYEWVWNIDGGFNWYAGPGAGIGFYSFDDKNQFDGNDSEAFIFVGGVVGIEYNFDIPLMISLDLRPEIPFSAYSDDVFFNFGLGVRYQF